MPGVIDPATLRRASAGFLLHGNAHIALVAAGLVGGTFVWMDRAIVAWILVAAGAGGFLLYQIDRAWQRPAEDACNQPERVAWVGRHRWYVWFSSAAALAVAAAAGTQLRGATYGAGLVLGVVGMLYLLPIVPGQRRLKQRAAIKPAAICGGWALGAVMLPALETGAPFSADLVLLFVYRFLFLLPNVLLADWPDRDGDRAAGIDSVAMRLAPDVLTRVAGFFCLAALATGLALAWRVGWSVPVGIDLAGPAVLFAAVNRPVLPASRWYYNILLDMVVAWPLLGVLVHWAG